MLTKKEAIRRHRLMWNWIADETEKQGIIVRKWAAFKHFGWDGIRGMCWCCEFASDSRPFTPCTCEDCPITWGTENDKYYDVYMPCTRPGSCYEDYMNCHLSGNPKKAAEFARQIANLPEREDV